MKVRICVTEEFPDEFRRAIRNRHGLKGLATREECRAWFIQYGRSMDEQIMEEFSHEDDKD